MFSRLTDIVRTQDTRRHFLDLQMSIPNLELFPNRVLKGLIGSPILDHDFSHLCFGRRFQISGHFDFGIFNDVVASSVLAWVLPDIASAACLAHPGSLEIMSMTFCGGHL